MAPPRGVAVAYPDGTGIYRGKRYWNDGRMPDGPDETRRSAALIDERMARGWVDPQHVYVTGRSNGTGMTNKPAAIAPVAGSIGLSMSAPNPASPGCRCG